MKWETILKSIIFYLILQGSLSYYLDAITLHPKVASKQVTDSEQLTDHETVDTNGSQGAVEVPTLQVTTLFNAIPFCEETGKAVIALKNVLEGVKARRLRWFRQVQERFLHVYVPIVDLFDALVQGVAVTSEQNDQIHDSLFQFNRFVKKYMKKHEQRMTYVDTLFFRQIIDLNDTFMDVLFSGSRSWRTLAKESFLKATDWVVVHKNIALTAVCLAEFIALYLMFREKKKTVDPVSGSGQSGSNPGGSDGLGFWGTRAVVNYDATQKMWTRDATIENYSVQFCAKQTVSQVGCKCGTYALAAAVVAERAQGSGVSEIPWQSWQSQAAIDEVVGEIDPFVRQIRTDEIILEFSKAVLACRGENIKDWFDTAMKETFYPKVKGYVNPSLKPFFQIPPLGMRVGQKVQDFLKGKKSEIVNFFDGKRDEELGTSDSVTKWVNIFPGYKEIPEKCFIDWLTDNEVCSLIKLLNLKGTVFFEITSVDSTPIRKEDRIVKEEQLTHDDSTRTSIENFRKGQTQQVLIQIDSNHWKVLQFVWDGKKVMVPVVDSMFSPEYSLSMSVLYDVVRLYLEVELKTPEQVAIDNKIEGIEANVGNLRDAMDYVARKAGKPLTDDEKEKIIGPKGYINYVVEQFIGVIRYVDQVLPEGSSVTCADLDGRLQKQFNALKEIFSEKDGCMQAQGLTEEFDAISVEFESKARASVNVNEFLAARNWHAAKEVLKTVVRSAS